MRSIQLGASGPRVSVVGQGTMGFGGYFTRETAADAEHVAAIRTAIDLGMSLIDTAEVYGTGHSEELVGKAIAGRRDQVIVATKFSPEHSAAADVRAAAEGSLRRMGTDYIDLYQTHWPNPKVPFEETLGALSCLLAEGKIRAVGLCNTTARQVAVALEHSSSGEIVSVQQQYNLVDRAVEDTLLPAAERSGLGMLAYSPLLDGRVAPADSRREILERIARERGISIGQVVLLWLLRHPNVVVIPKAAKLEHLRSNAACGSLALSEEDCSAISVAYAPQVTELDPALVDLTPPPGRVIYQNHEEAMQNPAGMTPSPSELASDILAGDTFRPIKVRKTGNGPRLYRLTEGGLRFWAWQIAYPGRRIPANIEEPTDL